MWQLPAAWRDETAIAAAWRAAKPFSHVVVDDFASRDQLDHVFAVLDDEHVARYEADLFAFEATAPGALRELGAAFAAALAPALSRITGKAVESADMRAFAYRAGNYLLPHSDHQDGLERRLAYAYYLPTPEPPTGGELELYRCTAAAIESACVIEPRANRLVVFDVGDATLHQVREVLAGARLSLAGWFFP
jgi:Rps23 Pro-64 3,4-dihydroxylase Tpa1-like proline 4-hydroxylase